MKKALNLLTYLHNIELESCCWQGCSIDVTVTHYKTVTVEPLIKLVLVYGFVLPLGNLVSLSEQNLVDCSKKEGDHGCEGGLMDFAFEYVEKNGGIDTEESYPYKGKDGKCKFTEANVGAKCTGKVDIKKGSEADLQKAVAEVGPISVAIDASSKEFRFYKSGVLNDHKCSSKKLDHGVLAVGYGTLSGDDYWLVKNSWGKSWGAKGYIMMSRNKDNQCGIATAASYPLM